MRNSILILVAVLTLVFTGCSKSKSEPEKPKQTIPVFDLRTDKLSQWDKQKAHTFMTLWQFKYYKKDVSDTKFVGFLKNENGNGVPYNILGNSIGRGDIYVYFQFILNFEVTDEKVANKLRDTMGGNGIIKQSVWAAAKNVANKNFDKERDLKHLNEIIVGGIMSKLRDIFKVELSEGTLYFRDDYTKNPLQIVDKNYRK
ncbi:hypothetical protein CAPN010_16570 [Capnocytophaga cynodegmi]|uniref:hypothetical protein n=1 Tax=Capnocytophaga cynodegmi TaxID=28189 RepID=UPI001EE31BBF|nr:hypothetical protein [Capnocytophaga cynodegmi]GJQ07499.1 hypothetical protein CAPN010_16570 [Capnocytophaga cynodegmi]